MAAGGQAPGRPGIHPSWSSSAKDLVTTALGTSRIWATFGYGIVNEVYWPTTGHPQIRDLGFIVAGPKGWTEVKRAQNYQISTPRPSVPLARVVHRGEDYRLELEFLPHPLRDVLLIRYALEGDDLRLYPLLAPHLGGRIANSGRAGEDLSASIEQVALCLRAANGFSRTSAGFAGSSDGWQDFVRNGRMTWGYEEATDGNIALMGELTDQSGTLALGFSQTPDGARTLARSSLAEDYDDIRALFVSGWETWGKSLDIPATTTDLRRAAELSAAVLKIHEDNTYAGAMVASLSVPWGNAHDDPGGYHLVWTRDTVQAALALIAVGQIDDAARTLAYLIGTQAEDGSWAQNYFPDGRGYWTGTQLDEVALPVVLMAKLRAIGRLHRSMPGDEMVRKAIGFIVRNGPTSDQDRWEENAGASPFTLAVSICALVAGAEFLSGEARRYVLALADFWNERIEDMTYAEGGAFCEVADVPGYYVRLEPRAAQTGRQGWINVRNVRHGPVPADGLVGMEFLYFVRTGLRAPDDPKILNTLKVVDTVLKKDTPSGPGYYRYNGDGYGEHDDGSAFDGTGVGRLWPLLTGERGHHAVMAGQSATPWLETMSRMTGPGGLMPEQVWDSEPIAELGLFPGKPSGSAMPLVWAHAEYLKLLAAGVAGRPAELLEEVEARYAKTPPRAKVWNWRKNAQFSAMPPDRALLIEALRPFVLHFGLDGWDKTGETTAAEGLFGLYGVRFEPDQFKRAKRLVFTFRYADDAWEGADFEIAFR